MLRELIDEEAFLDKVLVARELIGRKFVRSSSGATSDFVAGLEGKIGSIANYLCASLHMRAKLAIFSPQDLPQKWQRDQKTRTMLALRVSEEIIIRLLQVMQATGELFYMDGEWHVQVTTSNEVQMLERTKQSYRSQRTLHRRPSYRNDRRWHGLPSTHRKRLKGLGPGYAPGVSVGTMS